MPFGKLNPPPVPERHCRWRMGSGAWPEQLSISPDAGWFDSHCALGFWEPLLSTHAGKMLPLRRCKCCPTRPEPGPDSQPVAALELGSWEGNSTAWIASHMCWHTDSVLVAVDNWTYANQGVDEETEARRIADLAQVEQRFDANILSASEAEGSCGKIIKRKGHTSSVLPELQKEGLRFDFCYIDASHAPEDVLHDAVMAWPLVKSGGIIVFDDYGQHHYESKTCPVAIESRSRNCKESCCTFGWFGPAMDPAWKGPPGCRCTGRGVDAFLACYGEFCKVIDCQYQIALLKL